MPIRAIVFDLFDTLVDLSMDGLPRVRVREHEFPSTLAALYDVARPVVAMEFEDLAAAVFGREAGKVPFVILSQGKAREAGIGAGDLARELKGVLGGGGGGRPEQAQGQGADADAVPRAVETLSSRIQEALA